MKKMVLYMAGYLGMLGVLAVVLPIGMAGICLLIGLGAVLYPFFGKVWERSRREKQEYHDVTVYMEQMICSYKRLGNVRLALEDCVTLFSENSEMGRVLRSCLHALKTGEGVEGTDILGEVLSGMSARYPSRRLQLLHDFLCDNERMGGQATEMLDILLGDMQMWKKRTLLYQKKKFFVWAETAVSAALAVGLCGISEFLMPYSWVPGGDGRYYQWTSVVFLVLLLILETVVAWRMTGTWLDIRRSEEKDGGKWDGRRAAGRLWERFTGRAAERKIRREIEWEFPYWLLSLSLYLQQDSVYQAVSQSLRQVRGVFAAEVRAFLEGMYAAPSSLDPFAGFFQKWQIPEIQTGMKILYSVNANGYQDAGRQVHFLVEQSHAIMDKCEGRRFDDQVSYMGFLKQVPMVLACGKIVLDMIKVIGDMMIRYQSIF